MTEFGLRDDVLLAFRGLIRVHRRSGRGKRTGDE
jgi:hypothetical protein